LNPLRNRSASAFIARELCFSVVLEFDGFSAGPDGGDLEGGFLSCSGSKERLGNEQGEENEIDSEELGHAANTRGTMDWFT